MPEEFVIFNGMGENGPIWMAVSEEPSSMGKMLDPSAYFPFGTTDIKEVGRIQIEGDTHLLSASFDVFPNPDPQPWHSSNQIKSWHACLRAIDSGIAP